MIIYIIPILSCFIIATSKLKNYLGLWVWYIFLLSIFLCGGYMCGSDWRSYELIYNDIKLDHLFDNYLMEPGFYLYMLPFKFFHVGFWPFLILTKSICFIVLVNFITKFSGQQKYLALLLFIPLWGYYLFIDNPLRNLIAVSIFIASYHYILTRNSKKVCLITLIALSFHISAVVIPIIYIFVAHQPSKRILLVLPIILLLFVNNKVLVSFVDLFSFNEFVKWKIEAYIANDSKEGSGQIFSLKMLVFWCFYYLILLSVRRLTNEKVPNSIVYGSLLFVLLYQIGMSLHIFFRFQLYASCFFVVSASKLIFNLKKDSRLIYYPTILLIGLSALINVKNDGWKYIPYTNYFFSSITADKSTYSLRSAYNEKHTPYKQTNK